MRISTGIAAVALGTLAGCANMNMQQQAMDVRPPDNCGVKPGTCMVEVIVDSCKNIRTVPEPIVVKAGHQGPIQWTLDPRSGWEFYGGGISIHQAGSGEFTPVAGNSPTVVTWNNRHQTADKYKYDVMVQGKGGGPVCTYDPSIMN